MAQAVSDPFTLRVRAPTALGPTQLTSRTTGTLPFVFGQPFRKGDFAQSAVLGSDDGRFQASVLNRWPDGSIKFAIIAGRRSFAGAPVPVPFVANGPSSRGAALTLGQLQTRSPTAVVQVGGVGAADLAAVIGSPVEQSVAGPEMSEWIFQANVGTDADLHVRFYVRLFADGRIAILPSIGNGYVNTGPGRKVGRVVVTVDRAVRYDSGTDLTIYHHQRIAVPQTNGDWHWIGGDPQVTPRHDTQYLRATKFVPNYMATSVNPSVLGALAQTFVPQALCDLPGNQLGGGGDHPSIGYLPHWEACFVASGGDSRAYRATILNSFATGVYSYHYPDAKSRRPFRYSEWPAASRPARSGGEQYLSGQYGFEFDLSHEWPPGFLAYVLTGDRWHLEELQHNVGWGWLFLGTARVVNGQRMYDREISSRGVSWGLRNLMLALASTPDGDVLRTEFAINYGANASYWNGIGPLQKFPLGWRDQMETYSVYQGTYFDGRGTKAYPFTWEFGSYCFGWAVDLEIGASLTAQQSSDLSAWTAHCLAAATKWFGGGGPDEYNYRYAGVYQTWVGSDTSWPLDPATYFTTGGQAFAAQFGRQNGSDLVTDSRIMHLPGDPTNLASWAPKSSFSGSELNYFEERMCALAKAVDAGTPGASVAWSRISQAQNWSTCVGSLANGPKNGIAPRA